jgi:hypothetical protein
MSNDKGAVDGAEWGIGTLGSDECVAIWKDKGDFKSPKGLKCERKGDLPRREKKEQFWKETFDVHYHGALIATCEKEQEQCSLRVLAQ